MNDSAVRYVVAVLAAAVWQGMIGVMVKWISWPPFAMVSGRCIVASAALWSLVALRWVYQRRTGTASASAATAPVKSLLFGGALLAGHWSTLFWGYRIADVGPVIVAVFTYPVMASIAEPFVSGQRPALRQVAAALLSVAGVAAIMSTSSDTPGSANGAGVALGLLSAALWATRNIHARRLMAKTDAVSIMAWQVSVAAIVLSPALLTVPENVIDSRNLALLTVLGLAFTVVPHTVLVWAMGRLSAAAVGIIGSLQVVSGVVLASVLLGEVTHAGIWVGAVAVVGAVAWESLASWRATATHRAVPER